MRQGEYTQPRLMPHKGNSVIEARRILARQSVFLRSCPIHRATTWTVAFPPSSI